MENDIILEEGEEMEYIDYSDNITAGYTALMAVDGYNDITAGEAKRIKSIRSQALYLIDASLKEMVKQFDEAHE